MSKKIKMQWRTMLEWNTSGRVVKKGEKAINDIHLGGSRGWGGKLFSIEQTAPFDLFYISKKNGKIGNIIDKKKIQKKSSL